MSEPVWLSKELVLAIHDEQLREFGGASGIRDEGLLESALERPRNKLAYEQPELPELAAAYAFGLAKNHPFVDGNKRTAFVASVVFLEMNGSSFQASEEDVVVTFLALAAGEMTQARLARWFVRNTVSDA